MLVDILSTNIESISAITLFTRNMSDAVKFYDSLGFKLLYGGETTSFSSFSVGPGYLNLSLCSDENEHKDWGRVIIYVSNVDVMHERAVSLGLFPLSRPKDAPWGERYFHIRDPDGHEISFARRLEDDTCI
ncbi:MAG: glyoxalase [Alphaproteobacteria bacterium]|nr:glyoxalase [Alphaproteobacteria bacterium]PPR13060.1 MAG: hypothetical protein CFH42_01481 [Alphaproteobacteria bacterium MarineAlpha12_Bin1]|tara:strand:+ start:5704 stop:6096 length:393 start_codon:yes stop_codon:yes gene_type:complete